MDWFIFCPIRGLYETIPDNTKGEENVIEAVKELHKDIQSEGYKIKDIVIIRGERKELLPPGDWQLIARKPQ